MISSLSVLALLIYLLIYFLGLKVVIKSVNAESCGSVRNDIDALTLEK